MSAAILPDFLIPRQCDDLIRLGRDYDGGYLVSRADVMRSDALISFGISDDWSFEQDFMGVKACRLYAYDASTTHFLFVKSMIRATAKLLLGWLSLDRYITVLKLPISYHLFLRGNRKHIRKFIATHNSTNTIDVKSVWRQVAGQAVFLKIDIEGSEYQILNDILECADSLTCLTIEFHKCATHLADIKNFVARFPLPLIHVHANNYCPPSTEESLPDAMEFTFSRYGARATPQENLPHPLDRPNNPRREDIKIAFAQ